MTPEDLANKVRRRLEGIAGYTDTYILTMPDPEDLREVAALIEAFQLGQKEGL